MSRFDLSGSVNVHDMSCVSRNVMQHRWFSGRIFKNYDSMKKHLLRTKKIIKSHLMHFELARRYERSRDDQIAILTTANRKLSDDNNYLKEENKELKQHRKKTKEALAALANTC
jgi:hypothetical protein